jgi:hypothetical protein
MLMRALAANLRASLLLDVMQHEGTDEALDDLRPDVVLMDAAQVTPEQFRVLIAICSSILSIDPDTHQLNILCSPAPGRPGGNGARHREDLLHFASTCLKGQENIQRRMP